MDLADDFPLLASLVEQRKGGQRPLALQPARSGVGEAPVGPSLEVGEAPVGPSLEVGEAPVGPALEVVSPEMATPSDATGSELSSERDALPTPGAAMPWSTAGRGHGDTGSDGGPGSRGRRGEHGARRYGLSVQFESRLGDPELGRLVESTVWVNEAHPAYRRAAASRSEGYHVANL